VQTEVILVMRGQHRQGTDEFLRLHREASPP
jgi:hypothetical protein